MTIDTRFHDGIGRLSIRVEDARNALDLETIAALRAAIAQARANAALRIVILESAVDKVFSLGMNLAKLSEAEDLGAWASFEAISAYVELLVEIASLPVPTVAVVDGVAAAGGVELACVCDTVVGTTNASFSIAQLRKGIFPFITSAVVGPRIGSSRLLHWVLSGQSYGARRLYDLGLVNHICTPAERDREVRHFAERVASFDPHILRAGIAAVRAESDVAARIRRAHALFTINCIAHREEGGAK